MPSNNLRKLRRSKDVTLQQLATATGYAVSTIWNIETGANEPRKETAKAIARALGVRVPAIFPATNDNAANGRATGAHADRIAELLLNRSPSELGRIVTMLEAAFPR
jgi:transcriptional regulator with XRE-family HTH domain